MNEQRNMYDSRGFSRVLDTTAAWMLAILWALPLFYAIWTAFHPAEFSTRFSLTAPLTLENFANAWKAAPFARYFVNTIMPSERARLMALVPTLLSDHTAPGPK